MRFESVDPEVWVFCDSAQLENALLNLILNSRDAILRSAKGSSISVSARLVSGVSKDLTLEDGREGSWFGAGMQSERSAEASRRDGSQQRYVELSVTDDGPGMSAEVRRRSVDPFFTTKATNSGTGLGLSMVYGFVQQSDGAMRIYSEPGHGTTVQLLLPSGTASGPKEQPISTPLLADGKSQRIVLVEDEPELLLMTEALVSELGYVVDAFASPSSALGALEAGVKCDLLITDVVMPGGINGFELAKQVRALRPGVPILYMSGYTGLAEGEMGEVVAPVLQKPCAPADLAAEIRSALPPTTLSG